jgi:hypothetical protein
MRFLKPFVLLSVLLFTFFYGFSISRPRPKADMVVANIKARDFMKMSAKQYGKFIGKKMNLFDRLSFYAYKTRLNKELKKGQTPIGKLLNPTDINLLWFGLGFIGGVGVILAYITKQNKRNINSAWKGFAVFLPLLLLIYLISLFNFDLGDK